MLLLDGESLVPPATEDQLLVLVGPLPWWHALDGQQHPLETSSSLGGKPFESIDKNCYAARGRLPLKDGVCTLDGAE